MWDVPNCRLKQIINLFSILLHFYIYTISLSYHTSIILDEFEKQIEEFTDSLTCNDKRPQNSNGGKCTQPHHHYVIKFLEFPQCPHFV